MDEWEKETECDLILYIVWLLQWRKKKGELSVCGKLTGSSFGPLIAHGKHRKQSPAQTGSHVNPATWKCPHRPLTRLPRMQCTGDSERWSVGAADDRSATAKGPKREGRTDNQHRYASIRFWGVSGVILPLNSDSHGNGPPHQRDLRGMT